MGYGLGRAVVHARVAHRDLQHVLEHGRVVRVGRAGVEVSLRVVPPPPPRAGVDPLLLGQHLVRVRVRVRIRVRVRVRVRFVQDQG